MSLYNQLFEYNPLAPMVLEALRIDFKVIPRWRDAWFEAEPRRLVIYTRTGGPNRETHAAGNDWLRSIPGFQSDADDPYDETYAFWFYAVPAECEAFFAKMEAEGAGRDPTPEARWKALMADMAADRDTPDTRRSKALQETLLGDIGKQVAAGQKIIVIRP
jgi:hypothetical protein